MDFEKDWLIRQIDLLVEGAARELLHKPAPQETVRLQQFGGDDLLYYRICALLAQLEFCAAEDLLWENLRPDDPDSLELAEEIYRQMNEFGDKTLEAHGFSRQDITDGLERARKFFREVQQ